ncbi:MAG: bidirectional hydrogenase complex protein HoxE [Planctomycetota bacterium]
MTATLPMPTPPTDDRRWKAVEATMRRNGHSRNALIETLHTVQDGFGYLDDVSLKFVARALKLPLSSVYGVATFYHNFTLKPQGRHSCVVCTGTACYIHRARALLDHLREKHDLSDGQTDADGNITLLTARCLGTCSMAPAAVFDGQVVGDVDEQLIDERLETWADS